MDILVGDFGVPVSMSMEGRVSLATMHVSYIDDDVIMITVAPPEDILLKSVIDPTMHFTMTREHARKFISEWPIDIPVQSAN